MQFNQVSVPEVYKSSWDFRFFLKWFEQALTRIKFDTENMADIYDPLRCPTQLLWMLADTIGFKYDDRLTPSFNRLVLLYFMSMIRLKGSKDGVTLAAETNLAQFKIRMNAITGYEDENGEFVPPKEILTERLEDTTIPVNSVYVTPHTAEGYIDVVYFSTEVPIDACIEYVRPLGMYLFQYAGVRMDARTKISVDARLTDSNYVGISIGPTHVGHYRREDYARLQKTLGDGTDMLVDPEHTRHPVYYRNSVAEQQPDPNINPGYRALYSLQMCNNENVVKALISPVFDLGYGPQDVDVYYDEDYRDMLLHPEDYTIRNRDGEWMYPAQRLWNLRYNKDMELSVTKNPNRTDDDQADVYTIDSYRSTNILNPRPAPNPPMAKLGDSMVLHESEDLSTVTYVKADGDSPENTKYHTYEANKDFQYPEDTE